MAGSAAVKIPGTAYIGEACGYVGADGPDATCPGPCHDDAVGMYPNAFSFARTADGVGWLAWVATHRDLDADYQLSELEGDWFCNPILDRDDSFGVLHLTRIPSARIRRKMRSPCRSPRTCSTAPTTTDAAPRS